MPRYYFPATDGRRNVADDGGLLLASPEAARREARAIASELLTAEDEHSAQAWRGWRILVLDDAGDLISEVSLTDVEQAMPAHA
jgi:hypothetical protein